MLLQILGPVRLHTHEHIPVPTTKVRGLFGVLAFRANEPVPGSTLVEALWDDNPPADAAKALQPHVSRLRRTLTEHDVPARVVGEHRAYRLEIDSSAIDYHRFITMTQAGYQQFRSGEYELAGQKLATAVELWRGPAIADLGTLWARTLQDSLTERDFLPAYGALLDTKLRLGDHEFVLTHLRRLLADHPHHDQLATLWMRTLAATGRTEEVPAFLRTFTRRLAEDLGVKPSREVVRLYQELTESDTAAPTASRMSKLPRENPFFTGRTEVLDTLDAALLRGGGPTVVAVDGPPGVGKTTLVDHWARRRHSDFPGGILRIDLAGYAMSPRVEPAAAMGTFLHDLGVRIPDDSTGRAGALRQALAGNRVLIILDNAGGSAHVRPLLDALPAAVIVTSRARLAGLALKDGATRVTMPTMSSVEATELLTKRIGQRALDEPDATADLCSLCSGLPLALRLVAEHIADRPTPTLHELALELHRTRDVLDAGAQADDTNSTLRAAFSLSYDALRPATRVVFRHLGLHPTTTFSVPATTASCGQPEPVLQESLDELLGAHLVERTSAGRYIMHDLLHRYARALAVHEPDHERHQAFRRLLDWYLRTACRVRSQLVMDEHPVPDLPSVDGVTPLDLGTPAAARNWLLQERTALITITRQAADHGYPEHVWRLAACLTMLNRYEDPRELIAIHVLGHTAARQIGNAIAEGGCRNNEGVMRQRLGEDHLASTCFEQALAAFRQAGYSYGEALTMHNIGGIRAKLGNPTEAVTWHSHALVLLNEMNHPWATANAHRLLGDTYRALAQHELAHTNYRQALTLSQGSGDLRGQGAALTALARLQFDGGHLDDAVRIGTSALDLYDRALDRSSAAETLCLLATAYLARTAYADAMTCAEQALRAYRSMHDMPGQAQALDLLGRAHEVAGEPERAEQCWRDADVLYHRVGQHRAISLRAQLHQRNALPAPDPRN